MLRITRHGESGGKATDGHSTAIGISQLDALRSLTNQQRRNVMAQPRRWVILAAPDDGSVVRFADTLSKSDRQWKPVVVDPFRVDEAVNALEPEAVVVATKNSEDQALLRRAFALHGQRRIVVDDRGFMALSRILGARPG